MPDIGKAYVQIVPSEKGIAGSIQKTLNGEASSAGLSAGNLIGGNLVGTLSKVVAAAGIGKIVTDALSAGANLEQQIGGVETLFAVPEEVKKRNAELLKDSGMTAAEIEAVWQEPINTVLKDAQEAYKTAGMSQTEYMETITGFAAALNQSTGDVERSAEVGNMAVIDMSDNANKMGTSIDAIRNAYQGFAKQNYTMLDNLKLGYGGTASEMARLVNDAGLLGDSVEVTSKTIKDVPLDIIYESIHKVQQEMGITGTTAKEAASTFSGSLGMLKSSWQNVLAAMTMGQGLEGAMSGLGESLAAFGQNAFRMIGNLVTQIPALLSGVFTTLAPQILPLAQNIITSLAQGFQTAVPQMLTAAQGIIAGLQAAITTQLPMLLQNGVEVVNGIITGILQGVPQLITTAGQLLTGLVQAVMSALPQLLSSGLQIVMHLVQGIMQAMPSIITAAGQAVMSFINAVVPMIPQVLQQGVQMMFQFMQGMVQGIMQNVPNILATIAATLAQIIATIVQHFPQIVQTGFQLLGQVITGVINAIPQIPGAILQVINSIKEEFGKFDWASIGKNILEGIKNGILAAVDSAVAAAKSAGQAIFDSIKGFFNIGSPSKLMAEEVGKWIPAGIAVGITGNIDTMNRAITGALDAMESGVNANISALRPPTYSAPQTAAAEPTTVNVILQGDASKLFKVVQTYNATRTRATGYNGLALR